MSLTHQHLQSVCLYLPVVLKLFPLVIGEFVAAFLPTHFLTVLVQFWRQLRRSCEGGYIQERMSNHLQMSLQRQHFLLSYLKTLSVGRAGVWTRDLGRSADRRSTNWANQAAFRWFVFWISKPRISDSIKFSGHRNPDSFTWGEDIVKKLWNIKLQFTPLTETTSISFSFILGPSQPFQGWFSFSSDG